MCKEKTEVNCQTKVKIEVLRIYSWLTVMAKHYKQSNLIRITDKGQKTEGEEGYDAKSWAHRKQNRE